MNELFRCNKQDEHIVGQKIPQDLKHAGTRICP
jgi:hypothetical protein